MTARVLVVHCHPNPDSLVSAARDRVISGLTTAGHDIEQLDLYAESFDPVLGVDEWVAHGSSKEPFDRHGELLRWCDTLVFTYPTWFGAQPAMLKGWLDRVWTNGVAYELQPNKASISGRLRNIRRLHVVTTHGSSKLVNSLQGEPGKRVILRGLRALCHPLARGRWHALYGLDTADDRARTKWLADLETTMAGS